MRRMPRWVLPGCHLFAHLGAATSLPACSPASGAALLSPAAQSSVRPATQPPLHPVCSPTIPLTAARSMSLVRTIDVVCLWNPFGLCRRPSLAAHPRHLHAAHLPPSADHESYADAEHENCGRAAAVGTNGGAAVAHANTGTAVSAADGPAAAVTSTKPGQATAVAVAGSGGSAQSAARV